jgi:hypothetical protein
MASPRDRKVAAATTKLGTTIAGALRSWSKEVGADDLAGDVLDHIREGFDVVRDHAAAAQARTKSRRATKKTGGSTAKKAPKKARSATKRKTTRKTTRKATKRKAVRKQE